MAESKEELKSLLIKVKEESEKAGLIWAHHFMASRWGKMKTVADFIFSVFKITTDSDCSPKIKRRLLLGRKAVTNLDSVLKIRDITLYSLYSQSYGFSIVMYGCES